MSARCKFSSCFSKSKFVICSQINAMLEILALIFITRHIGQLAEKKGMPTGWWKFYTVIAWIAGEILGVFAAMFFFQAEDYIAMLPMAILGAVGGYLIVRAILSRMPDKPADSFDFEKPNQE